MWYKNQYFKTKSERQFWLESWSRSYEDLGLSLAFAAYWNEWVNHLLFSVLRVGKTINYRDDNDLSFPIWKIPV